MEAGCTGLGSQGRWTLAICESCGKERRKAPGQKEVHVNEPLYAITDTGLSLLPGLVLGRWQLSVEVVTGLQCLKTILK